MGSASIIKQLTEQFAPKNQLGRGYQSTVFKVTLNDHMFACKRIEIKQKENEDFTNEVQMLSALKHENILRLLYQT